MDKAKVIQTLNEILEAELAGVVRYTHYSFMVFGYDRLPIVGWLRGQATESLTHAQQVGEHITSLGGHPSLKIANLLEKKTHNVESILSGSLEHETMAVGLYRRLLELTADQDLRLEEYAREMVRQEQDHISEVEKMIGKPGS